MDYNFEKVLLEFKNDNGMLAHKMLKELSQTASWEDKCNFAEYILFIEAKYKESFLEDYALEYIVNGTEQGYKPATELLIKYVIKEKLSHDIWQRALIECQKLLEGATDDAEKEKYNKWKSLLKELKTSAPVAEAAPVTEPNSVAQPTAEPALAVTVEPVAEPVNKVHSIMAIVSSLLWVIVYVYFLIDLHSDVWSTSVALHWIPRIPDKGVLGIPFYGDYVGINGMFALILGVVASTLAALVKWSSKLKVANTIQVLSDILCGLIVIFHAYLQYLCNFSIFENIAVYLIMFGISIILGSVLGAVGRKIFHMGVKNHV